MITIISGTNRKNSRTRFTSDKLYKILTEKSSQKIDQINLEEITPDIYNEDMYSEEGQSGDLSRIQDDSIIPSDLWVIVSPEYNGSFSGAIKLFIDALSVRKYSDTFKGKKVGLIGVAAGRAGNLRGMEHLTGLLNYLGMEVFPNKLPISSIENQIEEESFNEKTRETLEKWTDGLLKFQ